MRRRTYDPRRPPLTRVGSLPPFALPPSNQPSRGWEPTEQALQKILDDLLKPRWSHAASFVAVLSATCGTFCATVALFALWVKRFQPPRLFMMDTEENSRLLRAMPILLRSYVPNILTWNRHLAGVFGYVKLPGQKPHSTERVVMPDGGTIALSWSALPIDGQPVVLLLPGINNDTHMPYVRGLMSVLRSAGHVVAALDWRGLGEAGTLTGATCTPRPYCALCDRDVASALEHLHSRLPSSPLYAIGFSLGAGMLLRHLGESGDRCLLSAAMAVSPSLDAAANYRNLSQGVQRLYLPIIMAPLFGYLFTHRRQLRQGPTPLSFLRDVLPKVGTVTGLDELYARLYGLRGGVHEYCERASAVHVLDGIARRTLIVHAEDDPIVPAAAMPLDRLMRNPHIVTALTRHGGHMGYTAGLSPLGKTWTDRLLVHFLRHCETERRTSSTSRSTSGGPPPPPMIPVFQVNSRL